MLAGAEIEHIGSTAAPGLMAKPIIDIMAGLPEFGEADRLAPAVVRQGYEDIRKYEDAMPFRRYFERWSHGRCAHHLHLVGLGGEFWKRRLAFRDYLRAHPQAAATYAALKTRLARRDWRDGNESADAKSEFIRGIERTAGVQ